MSSERDLRESTLGLKDQHEIFGLKAEFEAEGSRFDDLVVFAGIAHRADLSLVIKIGGCEAVSDLHLARLLSADKIVAPMIESTFALQKFANTMETIYGADHQNWPKALFNVETVTALSIIDDLVSACSDLGLDGIVVGRGDLAQSMGLARSGVEDPAVLKATRRSLEAAREKGLICGFGGGVTTATVPNLLQLATDGLVDYFETRKVLIRATGTSTHQTLRKSVLTALQIELLWLESKRELYLDIVTEDDQRMERLAAALEQS